MTKRLPVIYAVSLLAFGSGIYLILDQGRALERSRPVEARAEAVPAPAAPAGVTGTLRGNLDDPLGRLFLQLIVVVLAARLMGALATKGAQPAVIGEMAAGILLGPSFLGLFLPDLFRFLFPVSSLGTLRLLSQIGVCLFMFVVGMELDVEKLRHRAHTAVVVSHVGIVFPYFLGVAASLVLFPRLAAPGTSFTAFALFMGISMSITAFPVLARILVERGLQKTPLGVTALTCAAVDDVTAWSILAFVVAIAKARGFGSSVLSIGLVLLFVVAMLLGVKPRLDQWFSRRPLDASAPGRGVMAGVLVLVLVAALTTEVIGIHVLFGAFLAGVVIPARGQLREFLVVRIENFSSVFLLPLFFAFTGLRTEIGLLADAQSWTFALGIIFVATLGKLGGSTVAARLTGMGWADSFSLGALMNTRGLMELIALNIGYDLGILSPRIFTMLVLMALVTTVLTGPLLSLAERMRSGGRLAPA